MAKTSRNPFAPPPVPMKRRKLSKEAGALVPTAAVAVPAARTQKKKKTATTSAKQNFHLSDIDEESIYSRKPPLRICHHTSPTSSEILLVRPELRLQIHPLYCMFHRFLLLRIKIVTLSITLSITNHRTKTLLRNLLRK